MSHLAHLTRVEARRLRNDLLIGCGDNSCRFKKSVTGMGTNGGCRCMETIQERLEIFAMPGFEIFTAILDEFLTHYPPDSIVSSDKPHADVGARLTAALHKAREILNV